MTTISTNGQYHRMQVQNLSIQQRISEYGEQVATGKKTGVYGGLGSDARQSIDLRSNVSELDAYESNIQTAKLRVTSTVDAMDRITQIARDVHDEIIKLSSGNPPPDSTVVQHIAKNGFDEVVQLLNTKVDGRFIFAGSDIDHAPMADAKQLFDDVAAQVTAYPGSGAAATLAQTATTAAQDAYFSPALGQPDPSPLRARVDRNLDLSYQVRANGPDTPAGQLSPFREVLRGLATVANLSYDKTNPASFTDYKAMQDSTRLSLDAATESLDNHIGMLGNIQSRMESISEKHKTTTVALKSSISDIEDVDPAEVISKLQLAQTQLQASYKVTATLRQVSLVDFL